MSAGVGANMVVFPPLAPNVMRRPLSLRHVEAIHAALLTGSVTGAAARLHVSQPAVSSLLKEAEERLEFALFERQAGRFNPTARAELIFKEIERSFTGLDAINSMCERLLQDQRRTIVIASTPAFATAVLPRVLKAFREAGSDAYFAVSPRSSEYAQAQVASHKADIAFALREPTLPGVDCTLVVRERLVCLLPPGHPLASRASVGAADLAGEPMIGLSRTEPLHELVMEGFAEAGFLPRMAADCPAALMACAMVQAGNGFAILDPISAQPFRSSGIHIVAFEPALHLDVCAYTARGRAPAFDDARFIAIVQDVAQQLQAI